MSETPAERPQEGDPVEVISAYLAEFQRAHPFPVKDWAGVDRGNPLHVLPMLAAYDVELADYYGVQVAECVALLGLDGVVGSVAALDKSGLPVAVAEAVRPLVVLHRQALDAAARTHLAMARLGLDAQVRSIHDDEVRLLVTAMRAMADALGVSWNEVGRPAARAVMQSLSEQTIRESE